MMRTAVALLLAAGVAVLLALVAGMLVGGASAGVAWFALVAGGMAGGVAWWQMAGVGEMKGEHSRPGWVQWVVITVFTLFALRAFCWVMFAREEGWYFLSPNNLGDLSLHVTLIRIFANGAALWPESPIFAGEALHYPFGVDLLNALLLLAGVDLVRGLVWVGLLGSLAAGVLLWQWGRGFALAGFLFNGGLAAWRLWSDGALSDFQGEVAWKSIPLALFVTQRGLLYAVPVGLALLWSWRERFFSKGENAQARGLPLWVEGFFYATMPLFHLHTFLFLSWMLGAWLVAAVVERRWRVARQVGGVIAMAFLPASILVWLLTGGFSAGRSIHWQAGWMQEGNPVWFWLENFGVLPLLVTVLVVAVRKQWEERVWVWPAAGLFLLGCFVMFAAWAWDNTKLFLWCYLALLPSLWAMISRWKPGWRVGACLLLFGSGALSLVGGLGGSGYRLADRALLDTLDAAVAPLPVGATFAAVPTYDHPLLLVGRKVVMGYEGHLASYGIDYTARKAMLERLMRGAPGWRNDAAALGVDYLFLGEREAAAYGENPAWLEELPQVAAGEWGAIYAMDSPHPETKPPLPDNRKRR